MDCTAFRSLPADTAARDDDEGAAWRDHLSGCRGCEDFVLDRRVREAGLDPAAFPCIHLAHAAAHTCDEHDDPMACPHASVVWSPRFREWGLPIRDGDAASAYAYVVIHHCPWCGTALAPSLRAAWHEELARRGFANPLASWDQLPDEFRGDAWCRPAESD